ncbi:Serine protease [Entomophthora muscae]|uniref:Serine protease n=1 Tax=Entomophthora muscae TaxID=34485 RepID=A0ACC2SQC6_9FUNG|nr:Serine protease [Entomophthora muscae]
MHPRGYYIHLLSLVVFGQSEEKIINGVEVLPPFKYPWMAAIRMRGGPYCGGVFLNTRSVVTAAHCSKSGNNDDLRVLAHRHDFRKSSQDEGGFSLKVLKRIVHPEHDISLWHLEIQSGFQIADNIILGDIPKNREGSTLVTALGWGWLRFGGPVANSLQQVQVPLYDSIKCKTIWGRRGISLDPDSQVCAGWSEGKRDTCKGDSGGPLFYTSADGKAYLLGLTSFGEPCAKANVPTVYVKVIYFASWISENLDSYNVTTPTNISTITPPLRPNLEASRIGHLPFNSLSQAAEL